MKILGIGYSMHESAACVVQDGVLKLACAEERLTKGPGEAALRFSIDVSVSFQRRRLI
jgi:predicted NodU family carbamoyl transferase